MVLLMVSLELGFLPALAGVSATLALIPLQVRVRLHACVAGFRACMQLSSCLLCAPWIAEQKPCCAPTLHATHPQAMLVRPVAGIRRSTAARTDERVRLTGEVIQVRRLGWGLGWQTVHNQTLQRGSSGACRGSRGGVCAGGGRGGGERGGSGVWEEA